MYEFLQENALYVVLVIVLVCWIGIFSYLLKIDRKLTEVEKQLNK